MIVSSPTLAVFAENPQNLDMLTTIVEQVASEALSVTDAISRLDSLKEPSQDGSKRHWPGCAANVIVETGDRNWEKGYAWSLCVGALMRHLYKWLLGQSVDPDLKSHHLIAVAWHAAALYTFETRGLGTDDVRVHPRRRRVYIAGPISIGDRERNVRQAFEAAMVLLRAGYAPFVPHVSCYVERADGAVALPGSEDYERWLDSDFSYIRVCDALLRLPGESAGADREVAFARSLGIPVYESVEELLQNNDVQQ